MNKEEKLKSLTWRYFWQQKVKELGIAIIAIPFIIFVPSFIANFFIKTPDEIPIIVWLEGLVILMMFVGIIFVIIALLVGFIQWNWDKATDRAKWELKNDRRN